jgi:hypothetical protein
MSELEALAAELARVSAERAGERERMLAEFALGADELTTAQQEARAAERARAAAEQQLEDLRAELAHTQRELDRITSSALYPVFRTLQRIVRGARRVRARAMRVTQGSTKP